MDIRSLSKQIYGFIVEEIRTGNIRPGDKINESALLEKLPTSRTPIREALIRLASDGILENVPRKGFFVRVISRETMLEHYRIIALLDFYAIKQAIARLDEENYRKMHDIIDEIDAAIQAGDLHGYCSLSDSFHAYYYNFSGNDCLSGIIFGIRNRCPLTNCRSQDKDRLFAALAAVNREHRTILELAGENRLEELEILLQNHWANTDAYF